MPNIDIREFKSLFTNADLEDIDPSCTTEQENLRSLPGKLVKTFGFGEKISDPLTGNIKNLFTYIHDEISGDKLYVAIKINSGTHIATVYGFNGSSWVVIDQITGFSNCNSITCYHSDRRNQVINYDRNLRMLPGNANKFGGVEAQGIWLGHIDREFFDELYDPDAGFYDYPTVIAKPEITFEMTQLSDGTFKDEVKYYRFSYIYDGIQETLLSDVFSIYFGTDKFLKLDFSITKANHNKRITSMNVYRADKYDVDEEKGGIYEKIHAIDFLRESGKVKEDNAVNGNYFIYIPYLKDNYTFIAEGTYEIRLWWGSGEEDTVACSIIHPGAGSGKELFQFQAGGKFSDFSEGRRDYWDCRWELRREGVEHKSGDTGAFGGENCIFTNDESGISNFVGGVFYFYQTITRRRIINKNYKRAFGFSGKKLGLDSDAHTWKATNPSNGNYIAVENGNDVDYTFFDTNLLKGGEHPLYIGGIPKSIKVNGKYAKVINGRLWQGHLILDPGGKGEKHWDWVSFSEYGQLDVTPVSNVRYIADREGGPLTGLAEIFGKPVFTKEKALICINTKTDPYTIYESVHNIGNIAEEGLIEVLDNLYVCDFDGIYRLKPNNLAASDDTPTEKLRISEPINNLYNSLTLQQKKSIKTEYDQEKHEILFYISENVEIHANTQSLIMTQNAVSVNVTKIEVAECQNISLTQNDSFVWIGGILGFSKGFSDGFPHLPY